MVRLCGVVSVVCMAAGVAVGVSVVGVVSVVCMAAGVAKNRKNARTAAGVRRAFGLFGVATGGNGGAFGVHVGDVGGNATRGVFNTIQNARQIGNVGIIRDGKTQ